MKIYCPDSVRCFFEDYVCSWMDSSRDEVVPYTGGSPVVLTPGNGAHVFLQRLPEAGIVGSADGFGHTIGLVNTEQLSLKDYAVAAVAAVTHLREQFPAARIAYFDFSDANIRLLRAAAGNSLRDVLCLPVPYQCHEEERRRLRSLLATEPKEYDAAFVGWEQDRRSRVLRAIEDRGLKVLRVTGWGAVRDQAIARARVLVNIHCADAYRIHESMRCDRWVFAGMPVVTESSWGGTPMEPAVAVASYESLVDAVCATAKRVGNGLWTPAAAVIETEAAERRVALRAAREAVERPPTARERLRRVWVSLRRG